jgi:hypothetical protein
MGSETSTYSRDKRAMAGWVGATLGALALTVGGWAHATLWAHDSRITTVEVQQKNDAQRQAAAESRSERIENKVDRLDDKLNEILQRVSK